MSKYDERKEYEQMRDLLRQRGLKVEIRRGKAEIGHVAGFMPGIDTLTKHHCCSRFRIVYSAFEVEVRCGVPIYQSTVFGTLVDRIENSLLLSSGLYADAALHKDVYFVGRGRLLRQRRSRA